MQHRKVSYTKYAFLLPSQISKESKRYSKTPTKKTPQGQISGRLFLYKNKKNKSQLLKITWLGGSTGIEMTKHTSPETE